VDTNRFDDPDTCRFTLLWMTRAYYELRDESWHRWDNHGPVYAPTILGILADLRAYRGRGGYEHDLSNLTAERHHRYGVAAE
jgi:hypothetical protein